MDTTPLKRFAQEARRQLLAQVEARMAQVLETDSVVLREKQSVINELRALISAKGKENVIEEVAYTWFNRLCALRYMDVNHHTRMGVVSPVKGFTQPEILQNAKQGLFNPEWQVDRAFVQGLLSERITSGNAEQEAYRLLLVAVCNAYARDMDFLFEAIEDYTELLMPEDLLSSQSVMHAVQQALTEKNCQDVEVIGWLYQFYISEKKDHVMAARGAVKKEDIPAVTQLFTPDWIVRYMVQNSLGRLWLLNHPDSRIRAQMEYYIQPAELETDFLQVTSPEELKVLDPACGSGHILTYAFDLLYAIYEEQGYDPVEIPRLILQKNLYGIEIDKRAAMLSSFALMMKALSKDRRFFRRRVSPNILEMEDISFTLSEIQDYMAKVGRDLWTQDLWEGLQQFENAKTFGSLIRPVIKDAPYLMKRMREAGVFKDLFLSRTSEKVEKVLEMAEYLSSRYHVVVANPPYMGGGGLNCDLKAFLNEYYKNYKADLFSSFIYLCSVLGTNKAVIGMMSPNVWLYISTYEKLRELITINKTLLSLVELPLTGFRGATVQICSFIFNNYPNKNYKGTFIRLVDFKGSDAEMAYYTKQAIQNPLCNWIFHTGTKDFQKIPGSPIAYWLPVNLINSFVNGLLSKYFELSNCIQPGSADLFLRKWYEIEKNKISASWFFVSKGGQYRKWYGNIEFVINFLNSGELLLHHPSTILRTPENYFTSGFVWTRITSGNPSFRFWPEKFLVSDAGPIIYGNDKNVLGFLNSKISSLLLNAMNPTLNLQVGNVGNLPYIIVSNSLGIVEKLIEISSLDWNEKETAIEFLTPVYFNKNLIKSTLKETIIAVIKYWKIRIYEFRFLEEENNRVFIEAYGLQDELTPEVPLEEITLTCNPYYRYKGNYTDEERETMLLEDTIKEFLSYAVGCMFGRYSLDKPGLILANQGETLKDYLRIIRKEPLFTPTDTNVLPILDGDWFADDIVARFKQFLKVTFGEPNYDENLHFIEEALGKDLRRYFLKDFYKDHVQMYKKRPIYWLFSSPKGSFNALIYMHRYTQDTVSVVLNQYLREFKEKLGAHRKRLEVVIAGSSTTSREKAQTLKERESVSLVLQELKDYEDQILFPLAAQRININLDDGVKVNYPKFGDALAKIPGLSEKGI